MLLLMIVRSQMQTLLPGARVFVFVAVCSHVLIVNALSRRAVDLVELKGAGGGARGIELDRETDQREGDLSGPIGACHANCWMRQMGPPGLETWSFRPCLVV